jgi:hypothetical protein
MALKSSWPIISVKKIEPRKMSKIIAKSTAKAALLIGLFAAANFSICACAGATTGTGAAADADGMIGRLGICGPTLGIAPLRFPTLIPLLETIFVVFLSPYF